MPLPSPRAHQQFGQAMPAQTDGFPRLRCACGCEQHSGARTGQRIAHCALHHGSFTPTRLSTAALIALRARPATASRARLSSIERQGRGSMGGLRDRRRARPCPQSEALPAAALPRLCARRPGLREASHLRDGVPEPERKDHGAVIRSGAWLQCGRLPERSRQECANHRWLFRLTANIATSLFRGGVAGMPGHGTTAKMLAFASASKRTIRTTTRRFRRPATMPDRRRSAGLGKGTRACLW